MDVHSRVSTAGTIPRKLGTF
uniref:Uncharacterized protein n=1 Tax=Anguilla anguilla TaxID=7936 RepID=A0A0E9TMB5_ANGAN